jgi:hypothetical protein
MIVWFILKKKMGPLVMAFHHFLTTELKKSSVYLKARRVTAKHDLR